MNAKQAKIILLEHAIKRDNLRLKTATGENRKYLLFELLQAHKILAKINNL